jgi:succinoglycan biosynthesis transport protein ExoP
VAARARVADAEAKFTRIQAIKTENLSDAVVSDSLSSTLVGKLRQDYLDNSRKEAEWSARYGVNHTAAVNLRAQNRELQKSIAAELDRTREAYRSDVAVSRSNAASIQKQIDEVVARSTDTNTQRVELRALESMSDTYRALYASFLQRYTQAAQDQSFPISEIRIVTAGSVPLKPSAPKLLIVLPLGMVLGLVLGFAGAFLLEMLDHKLRTAGQVRAITGLDCLGLLPRLRRRDFAVKSHIKEEPAAERLAKRLLSVRPSVLRAAADQPFSIYAETLRGVRAKLIQHRARARDLKVVGCISAEAGEGKTTVAANLAQILAAAGHRTVLVDMDLRKPSLTRSIAAGSVAGIVDIVRGTATLDQAIWTDPKTGLHVIPAESTSTGYDAVDILHSDSLAGTLGLLRAAYDFVVLDLPPLGPVADSLDLGHIVDKLLVVVEWGKTDHEVLMEDLARADFDAQRLLGVVLNKADLRAAGRYAGTSRSQQYYSPALQAAS